MLELAFAGWIFPRSFFTVLQIALLPFLLIANESLLEVIIIFLI